MKYIKSVNLQIVLFEISDSDIIMLICRSIQF